MNRILPFLLVLLIISCNDLEFKQNDIPISKNNVITDSNNDSNEANVEIALNFINEYLQTTFEATSMKDIQNWVAQSPIATQDFKNSYNNMMHVAFAKDPVMGLGFDPIIDGQDSPSSYEVDFYEEDSNFLMLKGTGDMDYFNLGMILKNVNGKWLVDACGIVNMPKDVRERFRE